MKAAGLLPKFFIARWIPVIFATGYPHDFGVSQLLIAATADIDFGAEIKAPENGKGRNTAAGTGNQYPMTGLYISLGGNGTPGSQSRQRNSGCLWPVEVGRFWVNIARRNTDVFGESALVRHTQYPKIRAVVALFRAPVFGRVYHHLLSQQLVLDTLPQFIDNPCTVRAGNTG